jgi:pimeloyl-ACP methyl ester carboxylesterase
VDLQTYRAVARELDAAHNQLDREHKSLISEAAMPELLDRSMAWEDLSGPDRRALTEMLVDKIIVERHPSKIDKEKVVFDRLRSAWTSDLALSMDRLGEVSTPTLVIMGDGDIPSVEHARNISGRLADAQLAIVPDTSHALTMEKPDLVNRLILDFLTDPQTPKMF